MSDHIPDFEDDFINSEPTRVVMGDLYVLSTPLEAAIREREKLLTDAHLRAAEDVLQAIRALAEASDAPLISRCDILAALNSFPERALFRRQELGLDLPSTPPDPRL